MRRGYLVNVMKEFLGNLNSGCVGTHVQTVDEGPGAW